MLPVKYDRVARPGSTGDRRRSGYRPCNGATSSATRRSAAVCVNYVAHADAADRLAAEIVADGGRAISAIVAEIQNSVVFAIQI